jgi:hypothetical protein
VARDPLLMATTAQVVGMAQGELLQRSEMVAAVQGFTHDRLSPKVLDAVARNAASSWTQSGHLKDKVKKLRQPLKPQPVALALALWLGYASGKRGRALLNTPWATALDSSSSGLLELELSSAWACSSCPTAPGWCRSIPVVWIPTSGVSSHEPDR